MDVQLYQMPDGGEISCVNGQVRMSADGLENQVYLSLFGGNEQDTGSDGDKPKQWWGNVVEQDPARIFRSETQALLRALAAIPANLARIEDSAARDLEWLVTSEVATSVDVRVTMPGFNQITIGIVIVIENEQFRLAFSSPWKAVATS